MAEYLALVFPDPSGYWFTVPDIPGFSTRANSKNLQSATLMAQLALSDHLSAVVAISGSLPPVRTNEQLKSDPNLAEQWQEAETTVMLAGLLPADQSTPEDPSSEQAEPDG
jgi:predicted RNase H-like HicB family nuclease